MQNIDPIFIIQPIIIIILASALIVYWYFKRHFNKEVWLYSLLAYGTAIALKYAVQIPTINQVIATFGAHSVGLGIYYGSQTAIFEIGLASLVAWWAVSHSKLAKKDAEAFGSGLAFWENAAFLSCVVFGQFGSLLFYSLQQHSSCANPLQSIEYKCSCTFCTCFRSITFSSSGSN